MHWRSSHVTVTKQVENFLDSIEGLLTIQNIADFTVFHQVPGHFVIHPPVCKGNQSVQLYSCIVFEPEARKG